MFADWMLSPPVALLFFILLTGSLYWLSGRWAARSEDSHGKRQPYACGEDLLPGEVQLSYQAFFRLALTFVVAHMVVLVLATLPNTFDMRLLATVYLGAVVLCVDILARGES